MKLLSEIHYTLPNFDNEFNEQFLTYFSSQGKVNQNKILLNKSNSAFLPVTSFIFSNITAPYVKFIFDDSSSFNIDIRNITNVIKESPHKYIPIKLSELTKRLENISLSTIDHTGFNLPCFEGVHPRILKLRKELKDKCLYHTFPKELADEPWDFILPATKEEIVGIEKTNYKITRQPKIEIVSFSKSSTPLIQIDIQVEGNYEQLKELFPESIDVPEIRCLWIYINNNFGIDVCFVLNEVQIQDWSYYFEKSRVR